MSNIFNESYELPNITYLNGISVISFNKNTKLVDRTEFYNIIDENDYDFNAFYQANGWLDGRTCKFIFWRFGGGE